MESLLNTRSESKYPMVEMEQAFELVFAKAHELHLSKFAAKNARSMAKTIDEVVVGDILD